MSKEYFEPGNLHSEDVKKFKKEEDDKSFEYFEAKDENNCVVGYAYVLSSAKGSIRLEKKQNCSIAVATKKEEFSVKVEPQENDVNSNSSQLEETLGEHRNADKVCSFVKTTQKEVVIAMDASQEVDKSKSSNSKSEEKTENSNRWKSKDLINYQKYQCPYCDWALGYFSKPPCRYQQRLHVLFNHFSEDIFTALLTMLECTGGLCSLCGDRESPPQREGGWNNNYKVKRKEDYKMFTYHDIPLLTHFVARNHELTLTEGLVFSNNKLKKKNVDLLLDVLFPS